MRIFLAGATGVIGIRLLPLLVERGHDVAGMTRSLAKAERVAALGGSPVVCDVYDSAALTERVIGFRPDLVMHQLTDLPDSLTQLAASAAANQRIRSEGTRNLLAAASAAQARVMAQSIAWTPVAGSDVIAAHEESVLDAGGVVIRYGQFYGPGTYYEADPPGHPRIHIDAAAERTVPVLDARSGIVTLSED